MSASRTSPIATRAAALSIHAELGMGAARLSLLRLLRPQAHTL